MADGRNMSFRGYADYMQTPEFSEQLAGPLHGPPGSVIVLMCAEQCLGWCHRSLIADALVVRGLVVEETKERTASRQHALRRLPESAVPRDLPT